MSDTPRTTKIWEIQTSSPLMTETARIGQLFDHSRSIERELTAMTARAEKYERALARMCKLWNDGGDCKECPHNMCNGSVCSESIRAWAEQGDDAPPSSVVVGRVVEIGNVDSLDGKPGVVIETTMEQLRAHVRNLAFCEVEIRLKKHW